MSPSRSHSRASGFVAKVMMTAKDAGLRVEYDAPVWRGRWSLVDEEGRVELDHVYLSDVAARLDERRSAA